MKKNKTKKKIGKGDFGYYKAEKKRRALITLALFSVPLFIFFAAWIYNGDRNTIWTVIAVVGCLPACKFAVDLIMIMMRKPMSDELHKKISDHAGNLTMSYEMYMTSYEKSAHIDAIAICGNEVVAYSSDPKIDAPFMADHAQKIVRKNGYKVNVKILTELRAYLERLDGMNEHQESLRENIKMIPDDRYPNLSREEIIKRVILAICL